MSAGEVHGGYQPRARRPLTPLQRAVHWAFQLWLAAWVFCQIYFPAAAWVRPMGIPFIILLGLSVWLLPSRAGDSEDDDDYERLTPTRRFILVLLFALFAASYIAFEYAAWAYELSPRWMDYVFPVWLVMLGIAALAWPRNPHSEMDMRPVWAISAFLFAAFFIYSMVTF